MKRFWTKTTPADNGCILWTGARDKQWGYGRFFYRGTNEHAHRVAWILTHGDPPLGLCVCHRCDTPHCVNPAHLFLGTNLDNTRDMFAKGREASRVGERNPKARLTGQDVVAIRNSPLGHSELGRAYGVTPQAIFEIRKRKRWRHID